MSIRVGGKRKEPIYQRDEGVGKGINACQREEEEEEERERERNDGGRKTQEECGKKGGKRVAYGRRINRRETI